MLTACTANNDKQEKNENVKNAIAEAVVAESTTTVTALSPETSSEQPFENEIILKPIAGEKLLEAMKCEIISDFWVNKEEEFLNKEHLKTGKEICYADEKIKKEIDRYNEDISNSSLSILIESPNDICFDGGGTFDFDSDGEDESLLCLSYTPGWAMGGCAFVYVDKTNTSILIYDSGCSAHAEILDFDKFLYVSVHSFAGVSSYFNNIYNFKNGIDFAVKESWSSRYIEYDNGIFMFAYKWDGAYPVVCCSDGEFRQLAVEKITSEEFSAHIENGNEYLNKLLSEGNEITEIYTCGHLKYWLYGDKYEEHFIINKFRAEQYDYLPSKDIVITDELIYGGDLWNVKLIS